MLEKFVASMEQSFKTPGLVAALAVVFTIGLPVVAARKYKQWKTRQAR